MVVHDSEEGLEVEVSKQVLADELGVSIHQVLHFPHQLSFFTSHSTTSKVSCFV